MSSSLPTVGQTEPENFFDEEIFENSEEPDFTLVAFDQIESADDFGGSNVKVEIVDEDETFEVIEMDEDREVEELEVDWETEEMRYETGHFVCQWEIGRSDPTNGIFPEDTSSDDGVMCGMVFESRAAFVEHSRHHIDKYDRH